MGSPELLCMSGSGEFVLIITPHILCHFLRTIQQPFAYMRTPESHTTADQFQDF